jgi:hypothetical protein
MHMLSVYAHMHAAHGRRYVKLLRIAAGLSQAQAKRTFGAPDAMSAKCQPRLSALQ